jgi:hypothetical protein
MPPTYRRDESPQGPPLISWRSERLLRRITGAGEPAPRNPAGPDGGAPPWDSSGNPGITAPHPASPPSRLRSGTGGVGHYLHARRWIAPATNLDDVLSVQGAQSSTMTWRKNLYDDLSVRSLTNACDIRTRINELSVRGKQRQFQN